jgi:hypothetical protein
MAVNESRSMNRDMTLGATDGKFKSLTPGRGGEVEIAAVTIRSHELQLQYDVVDRAEVADMPRAQYGRRR